MARVGTDTTENQRDAQIKTEMKTVPSEFQTKAQIKIEMETVHNENQVELQVRKRKKQHHRRRKRASDNITEVPKSVEPGNLESNTAGGLPGKCDVPGQNRAQKRKRIRRRNKNKKLQVTQDEPVVDVKIKKEDCDNTILTSERMTEVETVLSENQAESQAKKKRRPHHRRRKRATDDIKEFSKKEESVNPEVITIDLTEKPDSVGLNGVQKRKRKRRKNKKKLQGAHDEPVVEMKTENDDCTNAICTSSSTHKKLEDGCAPGVGELLSVKPSCIERKKRTRRRKKTKSGAIQGNREVELQIKDKGSLNVITLDDIKAEVPSSSEVNLNVSSMGSMKIQENDQAQKRKKRKRAKKKANISESDTEVSQTFDAVSNILPTAGNEHPVVSGQNKRRKKNHVAPDVVDVDNYIEVNKKLEKSPKGEVETLLMQRTGAGDTPAQPSKKKRNRHRKRKQNKVNKVEAQIVTNLASSSHENGDRIIEGTDIISNRKRGITEAINNLDTKKMKLGNSEIKGISSTALSSPQPHQQGKNPSLKKTNKNNTKTYDKNKLHKVFCATAATQDNIYGTVDKLRPDGICQEVNSTVPKKMIKDEAIIKGTTTEVDCVSVELNSLYCEEGCINEIREHWVKEKDKHLCNLDTGVEVIKDPFTCCYVPDFLKNSDCLKGVKDELQDIELTMRNNDLYKFRQTSDLKNITSPHIAGLRNFLYSDFRKWLIDVTGIPLNDTVAMSSSRYEYTDVLLCHDDELEGRRIAYILYLVPWWEEEDGGSLDLFSTDEHGQPKDIVKSLIPKWNAFAFFEVSPVSFHQVAEVLSRDKVRLSINGWFHGPPVENPPKYIAPARSLDVPVHIEESELYSWINPTYLDMDVQKEIRHKFRANSEVELESFLVEDKFQELAEALRNNDLVWQCTGPANKQYFEALKLDQVPDVINRCLNFLKSEAVFLILSQLTGLKLHKLAPPDSEPDSDDEDSKESCPRVSVDVRHWRHGCYSLLRDDTVGNECALDANLFINIHDKWSQEYGGFISYIAKDEDDELLTVMPRPNRFALVYRDAETLRFTKHINASVCELGERDSSYNNFACVYYE